MMSTPDRSTPATSAPAMDRSSLPAAKPQRVLACVLCQQRKVKCNRIFPCSNCVRSNAQCVPATTRGTRRRHRRLPERELLDRLRHYESLLRQGNINFDPLHRDHSETEQIPLKKDNERHGYDSSYEEQLSTTAGADQSSSPSTTLKSETVYEAKSFWRAMNHKSQSPGDDETSDSSSDVVRETEVKDAWIAIHQDNDHLLFGARETTVNIVTLHPEQIQIFRLWQIYLDNVNPLLKVTHTPTLQARIIDAASNLASTRPPLEALMFSIYCVAVMSLDEDDCRNMFDSAKKTLLTKYQFACQQALQNCGFLRSGDRDCLTALYLYLLSIRSATVPQSLSSMLAVAIRIAQRMGLHNESAYAKYPALEAEMRRRLWWSLVLFDTRICEMSDYKTATLLPTWDCRTPLNLNDFDLRPEMKEPPPVQEKTSEALFVVVRSEMGEFVRHSAYHLDFVNPALKAIAKDIQGSHGSEGGALLALEKTIEEKHLKFCNTENPLQFMTIWTARLFLARNGLLEHYARFPNSSVPQTDAQRDSAIGHALGMLECDTELTISPLTKGYLWFLNLHFPFLAYVHICQDLRARPASTHAERTWATMSDNYEARFTFHGVIDVPIFHVFAKIILQAWEVHEATFRQQSGTPPPPPPLLVSDIRQKVAQTTPGGAHDLPVKQNTDVLLDMNPDWSMSVPPVDSDLLFAMGGQDHVGFESWPYHDVPGQTALGVDLNGLNLTPMDWNALHRGNW